MTRRAASLAISSNNHASEILGPESELFEGRELKTDIVTNQED